MLSSLLALIFVFGLLAGALFLLRHWGRASTKGHTLKVVETVDIGPGKSLSLVAVGSKGFLLAATTDRIYLVSEIEVSDLKVAVDLPENTPDTMADSNAASGSSHAERLPAGYLRSFNAVLSRRVQRDSKIRADSRRT